MKELREAERTERGWEDWESWHGLFGDGPLGSIHDFLLSTFSVLLVTEDSKRCHIGETHLQCNRGYNREYNRQYNREYNREMNDSCVLSLSEIFQAK